MAASKPPARKPAAPAPKPARGSTKPASATKRPSRPARKPAASSKGPAAPAKKPAAGAKKPAARAPKPTPRAPKKPAPATRKPAAPPSGRAIGKDVAEAAQALERGVAAAGTALKATLGRIASGSKARAASATSHVARSAAPAVQPPFAAYRGTRPYLFVSYAHRDTKQVFPILAKLRDRRLRIWYDEGIEPGAEWPEIIGKAVLGCSTLLVFMSRHASESRNVRNEINLAYSVDKPITVLFLEPTALTEGLQLQIGTVQSLFKHELGERALLDKLVQGLPAQLRG